MTTLFSQNQSKDGRLLVVSQGKHKSVIPFGQTVLREDGREILKRAKTGPHATTVLYVL